MPQSDRIKWDEKYARGDHAGEAPSTVLTSLEAQLPRQGRAIDVAGGAGRHALWLAQRGLAVTLADISPVALNIAGRRAAYIGVPLELRTIDLEEQPFPEGPWDLILSFHYLWRPLYEVFPTVLAAC